MSHSLALALGISELSGQVLNAGLLVCHLLDRCVRSPTVHSTSTLHLASQLLLGLGETLVALLVTLEALRRGESRGDLATITHEQVAVGSGQAEGAQKVHLHEARVSTVWRSESVGEYLVEGSEEAPHLQPREVRSW